MSSVDDEEVKSTGNPSFDEILNKMENLIAEKVKVWNNTVNVLSNRLKNKEPKELIDLQADVISHKQMIIDESVEYAVKLAKDVSKKKKLYKKHFELYKTEYNIKTNVGELGRLIESELALHERKLNIYESYIEFLKDTGKNLEQINYGIKNKIELINLFGID